MNRLLLMCALCGLFILACSFGSNTSNQNSNTPTGATPSNAQPNKPTDTGSEKQSQGDVTGAYFPAEGLPSEFSEIEHLHLATIDENGNRAPLNGFIRPKRRSAKDYQLVTPKMDGRNLTFTTTTVGGVGYSFNGAFEKLDNFSANPPPSDQVILKGVLIKTQDGQVVSEAPVSFTYSAGG
jgi:hypothetical protein